MDNKKAASPATGTHSAQRIPDAAKQADHIEEVDEENDYIQAVEDGPSSSTLLARLVAAIDQVFLEALRFYFIPPHGARSLSVFPCEG